MVGEWLVVYRRCEEMVAVCQFTICVHLPCKERRGDLQMHEAKAITEFRNSCLKRLLTVNSEIRNDPDVYFHVAAFVSLLVIAVVILPGRRESSCFGALAGHVCKSKCALVSATASFSVTMDPNGRGRQLHPCTSKVVGKGKATKWTKS